MLKENKKKTVKTFFNRLDNHSGANINFKLEKFIFDFFFNKIKKRHLRLLHLSSQNLLKRSSMMDRNLKKI